MSFELPDEVSLPRDNGELLFASPWEARALAVAVALTTELGVTWDEFRHRLMAAIADEPDRPYYESWAVALEDLVVAHGLATPEAIDAALPAERAPL